MPRIPILTKGEGPSRKNGAQCRENATLARPLPVFYMSDYSVLGLRVDRPRRDGSIARTDGVPVINEAGDIEVVLESAGHLEGIVQLLKATVLDVSSPMWSVASIRADEDRACRYGGKSCCFS